MNRLPCFILFCLGWTIASAQQLRSTASSKNGILYQVGFPEAFMAGMYTGILSIHELKKHGDFGIGAPAGWMVN